MKEDEEEYEEEEDEEYTSLLMGATLPDTPDMAGAMSFLPKLSRLLDTLLMFSGAAFAVEADLWIQTGQQTYKQKNDSGTLSRMMEGF